MEALCQQPLMQPERYKLTADLLSRSMTALAAKSARLTRRRCTARGASSSHAPLSTAVTARLQAQEIFIQESFARQPFAEGIILKTKRGARFQPAARKWKAADDTGSQPYLRITETHGDSVLTLPADSQVRH